LPVAAVLLIALCGHCAHAGIRVQGPAHDVRVEAYGATVAEILAALGEHYEVRYRGVPGNRVVSATFGGPLRRVLVRMLEGNNYVIKGGGEGLEVILVSLDSPTTSAPAPTTAPTTLLPQVQLRVQGPADDVHVEVYGATVTQSLAAFGERYAVRYRGTPESSAITATFGGPLRRVLVRVLSKRLLTAALFSS
jgi:hypothetical protein